MEVRFLVESYWPSGRKSSLFLSLSLYCTHAHYALSLSLFLREESATAWNRGKETKLELDHEFHGLLPPTLYPHIPFYLSPFIIPFEISMTVVRGTSTFQIPLSWNQYSIIHRRFHPVIFTDTPTLPFSPVCVCVCSDLSPFLSLSPSSSSFLYFMRSHHFMYLPLYHGIDVSSTPILAVFLSRTLSLLKKKDNPSS